MAAELRLAAALSLVVALIACSDDPAASQPQDSSQNPEDSASQHDSGALQDSVSTTDTGPAQDVPAGYNCQQGCKPFTVCGAAFPTALCEQLCAAEDSAAVAQQCLKSVGDCDALTECMASAGDPPKKPLRAFNDGKTGLSWKKLAGDFTIPTRRGPFTFSQHFDGHSSYIFVFVGQGVFPTNPNGLIANLQGINNNDIKQFFANSPDNAHYFFIAYKDANGADNTSKHLDPLLAKFDTVLKGYPPLERLKLRSRLHFATKPAPWTNQPAPPPNGIGGWLGEYTTKRRPAYFAIDRFQLIRQIGLLRLVQQPRWLVHHLPFEARYYNFEHQRAEQHPENDQMKIVTVYDAKTVNTETADFELPDAKELAKYDTVEVDLAHDCVGHDQANCFEWDYHAHLRALGRPKDADGDKDVAAQCQVKLGEIKEQQEVLGACELAGKATDTTCKAHCDCEAIHGVGATCKGYKPAKKAAAAVTADTKACDCIDPRGEVQTRQRTCKWIKGEKAEAMGRCVLDGKNHWCKACKTDKDCGGAAGSCKGYVAAQTGETGWGKCACKAHFLQRWITTYHREGRWTTVSPRARWWLANGGKVRLNYKGSYPYVTTLKFRYLNKGSKVPTGMVELFTGGGFNPGYNSKYEPMQVTIPKTAKKVELAVDVSGHGFGDKANCAEFCDHTHHFWVKSAKGEKEHVKTHPKAGQFYGCAQQVDEGTVPNQFGTWYLGRGGWCPGKDVRVQTWDITGDVKPGETVTIRYKGLYNGKDYKSEPGSGGGFGARIDMTSWVMFYE